MLLIAREGEGKLPDSWEISGRTQVAVHLAYPVGHLKTPQLFNARCRERNIDAVLVPWQVHPDNLKQVFDALALSESVCGVVVTIPHKETVARLCDALSGPAAVLEVANVARKDDAGRWHGLTFDGAGFVGGLSQAGHRVEGKSVLLLGAGGVALAIADALCSVGVRRLMIHNRTLARAEALAANMRKVYPAVVVETGPADATGFDVIVNGTSVGMKPEDPLPLDGATLAPGMVVAEVIMAPAETDLLKAAGAAGCKTHAGHHMLTGQIDYLIDFLVSGQMPA